MSTKTDFLELTLPANGEYTDNWGSPVNSNFEIIDDHLSDLHDDLVGAAGDTANLSGTKSTLQERLDVGISDDGTLDLENTTDFTDLEKSKIYGTSGSGTGVQRVIDRLDAGDLDAAYMMLGAYADMWENSGVSADIQMLSGMARHSKIYSITAVSPISGNVPTPSPIRGFVPNCIASGELSVHGTLGTLCVPDCIAPTGTNAHLKLTGGTTPIYANINGIYFKIDFDYTLDIAANATADTDYYVFLSRLYSDFNRSDFSPGNIGGSKVVTDSDYVYVAGYNPASKKIDPRILATHDSLKDYDADNASYAEPETGTITIGSSILSDSAGDFDGVVQGDLLVITSPASVSGTYLIESSSTTSVTIRGEFRNQTLISGTAHYHIIRPTIPALGFVEKATAISTPMRAYIGEFSTNVGDTNIDPTSVITYAYNGVFDTGWVGLDTNIWNVSIDHHLGTVPSQLEIWVKGAAPLNAGSVIKDPTLTLKVDSVDEVGGSTPTTETVRFPAFIHYADSTELKVNFMNPCLTSGNYAYTDYSGTYVLKDSASHSIRIIARR